MRGVRGLMYRVQAGVGGCYKLLNATAELGCEGVGLCVFVCVCSFSACGGVRAQHKHNK